MNDWLYSSVNMCYMELAQSKGHRYKGQATANEVMMGSHSAWDIVPRNIALFT